VSPEDWWCAPPPPPATVSRNRIVLAVQAEKFSGRGKPQTQPTIVARRQQVADPAARRVLLALKKSLPRASAEVESAANHRKSGLNEKPVQSQPMEARNQALTGALPLRRRFTPASNLNCPPTR